MSAVNKTLVVVVLILSLLGTACQDDQIRKAAAAANKITLTLEEIDGEKDSLLAKGKITKAQHAKLAGILLKVVKANNVFNEQVAEFKRQADAEKLTSFTPQMRDRLRELFNQVTAAFKELADDGVIPLPANIRQNLDVAILAVNGAFTVINGVLYVANNHP